MGVQLLTIVFDMVTSLVWGGLGDFF